MTHASKGPGQSESPLRDSFLGWQCRIRQMAMRQHAGFPLPGMRPRVTDAGGREIAEAITIVILYRDPARHTDMFRHMVRRTRDPAERHESAVKMLSSAYFQDPDQFSDHMTALFSLDSELAASLVAAGECVLTFEQFNQTYRLPCAVASLDRESAFWQGTYWHNHAFNASLPGDVLVLSLAPDWGAAEADPPIGAGR